MAGLLEIWPNAKVYSDVISACEGNPMNTKLIVWTVSHASDMLHQARRAVSAVCCFSYVTTKTKKQP